MECNICHKIFKNKGGCNSHIIKSHDEEHMEFKEKQIKYIKEMFYTDVTAAQLAKQVVFKALNIINIWKEMPNFEEQYGIKRSKTVSKYRPKKNKLRTPEDKIKEICAWFNSALSLVRIAKKYDCDERTIRKIFERNFGEEETKSRCMRIRQLHRKHRNGEVYKTENKKPEAYKKVIDLFKSDLSLKEIGKIAGVFAATAANIYRRTFGDEEYMKRVSRMVKVQKLRATKDCKTLGSKNEILCYDLLKEFFLDTKHHNYTVVAPLELDIIIPSQKVAISWDGPSHRRDIYGEASLIRTIKNDAIRDETLKQKIWRYIVVVDDGSHNPIFVEQKVKEIIELVNNEWEGKVVI